MSRTKIPITFFEKFLLGFLILFSLLVIFFFVRINNKCLFVEEAEINKLQVRKNDPIIIIEAPCGKVAINLFENLSPKNTARILKLINQEAYDDVSFHRVIRSTLVQTGDLEFGKKNNLDYLRVGNGGSKFGTNTSELNKKYFFKRGSVGMVRTGQFNTEDSQFFILLKDIPQYNGQYTPVGEVIAGIEVLDKIKYDNKSQFVLRPDFISKIYILKTN